MLRLLEISPGDQAGRLWYLAIQHPSGRSPEASAITGHGETWKVQHLPTWGNGDGLHACGCNSDQLAALTALARGRAAALISRINLVNNSSNSSARLMH